MEQLIPIINKLQDVFNTIGQDSIDLPQIVVIGSQSSGKSSVLENVVGRDFLPRGAGIVTRRPLVLQLINLPQGDKSKEDSEWGEFLHKPNEMFRDFNEIRDEIQRETDRLTGKNKGISGNPINLKIFSPNVLNLTLVDLPGITRVPIGDQPTDIELQIRKMIFTFISKPNAVILAVTAANSDLSNSDALQMAREVDPEGLRTLGVLTKIDIMDKGTDAMDMLLGKVIPLKLGYIAVINRSQQDIISKKPIKTSLKEEADFFSTHPLYRTVASRCGSPFLAKTLNRILLHHIRDCLPDLKVKINKMIQDTSQELSSYGENFGSNANSKGALLLQIITKFSNDYRDAIEGKLTEFSLNELCGGARINYIFNEIFGVCLNTIQPTDGLTINDIRTAIRNATGPRAALFVPEVSFELLVKRQIMRLEEPSLQCVELVFDELQRIVSQLESKELQRFQTLRDKVVEVFNLLLSKCRSPTKMMISNLVFIELSYINTNHPDFVGGGGAINAIFEKMAQAQDPSFQSQQSTWGNQSQLQNGPTSSSQLVHSTTQQPPRSSNPPTQPAQQAQRDNNQPFFNKFFDAAPKGGAAKQPPQQPQKTAPTTTTTSKTAPVVPQKPQERLDQVPATIKAVSAPTDKESFETELIQSLLKSYFDIVRKNVKDSVPKSIMHFLVNSSRDNLQKELVSSLYKEELFDELLEESPAIAERRALCRTMLDTLRRAHDILSEVRDFSVK